MVFVYQCISILFILYTCCSAWNWKLIHGKENCVQNCDGSRERRCEGNLCNFGILTQTFRNCNYPNVCDQTDLITKSISQQCQGTCDRAIERVNAVCGSNVQCSVIQSQFCSLPHTCTGQWSNWSEYGACNASCGGYREREKRCYTPGSTTVNYYCNGGMGKHVFLETVSCICKDSIPSPRIHLPDTCDKMCESNANVVKSETLLSKCNSALEKSSVQPEALCRSNKQFVVSCKGTVNERLCAIAENPFYCGNFEEWTEWGTWRKGMHYEKEFRYRHQWCTTNVPSISNRIPCQRAVRIEKICRSTANQTSPTSGFTGKQEVKIWVIIVLILLIVVIAILIACLCIKQAKKNIAKRHQTTNSRVTDIRNIKKQQDLTETQVIEKCNTQEDSSSTNISLNQTSVCQIHNEHVKNNSQVFLKPPTIGQRLIKASEHLYETISRRHRMHSKSSVTDSPAHALNTNSHLITENEDSCNESTAMKENKENNKASPENDMKRGSKCRNPKYRISVTVTNPDGIQVDRSVYKPKLHSTEQKSKANQPLRKMRWSRVPTPQPATSNKFFDDRCNEASKNPALHVQSVKYKTGKPILEQTFKSPKKDIFELRKLFLKMRKSPPKKLSISAPHQYDDVPKEIVNRLSNGNEYSSSAPVLVTEGDDDASIWSDSTFDEIDDLDEDSLSASEKDMKTQLHLKRSKRKSEYVRKKGYKSQKDSKFLLPSTSTGLQISPPNVLTPNTDVRSPMPHRWSDETKESASFKFSHLSLPTTKATGYTDMNRMQQISSEFDSSKNNDIRNWIQLENTPLSQKDKDGIAVLKNSETNKDATIKLREVEAKYVTPEHIRCKLLKSDENFIDNRGYLHLC